MNVKVVENPTVAPKRVTPAELAAGQQCVLVYVDQPITLVVDGDKIVTFGAAEHRVPTEVSNALVAAGAELIGSQIPRAAEGKPKSKFPGPTRGGAAGSIRFNI
jgi:hypothetical protein